VRVFLAGASGVIGVRLMPLLVSGGHVVAAMTRSPEKVEGLRALGAARAIVCDVYDAAALQNAVVGFGPECVIHQLTDLPDDRAQVTQFMAANARIRREGTRNLLAAARAAGVPNILAQSVAWALAGDAGAAIRELEQMVVSAGGTALRYGLFYGPGTYYETEVPAPPRVHVDEAARRTVAALYEAPGVIVVTDP
jgi:nucleoside-diphosphate-sugar epimerase